MPFWLSQVIGDGSDAEGNELRPALHEHQKNWGFCTYAGQAGWAIVKADHVPAFDGDHRIRPMRKAQLAAMGACDDGETDDYEAPDLALKFTKRFLLRQMLGADDFARDLSLDQRLRDVPAARRSRIRAKLLAYRRDLDLGSLTLDTSIRDALRFVLPQLHARITEPPIRKSGTFTDDFTAASDQDLGGRTASGGGTWTVAAGGVASHAKVIASTDNVSNNTTDANGTLFQCTDEGSPNQYVQVRVDSQCNGFTCNRASGHADYIGFRIQGGNADLFKRVGGAFTRLGSAVAASSGSVMRLESDGANLHTLRDDGVFVTSATDSHNSTITRQGINARSSGVISNWLDNFEAGTLASAVSPLSAVSAALRGQRSTLLRM